MFTAAEPTAHHETSLKTAAGEKSHYRHLMQEMPRENRGRADNETVSVAGKGDRVPAMIITDRNYAYRVSKWHGGHP